MTTKRQSSLPPESGTFDVIAMNVTKDEFSITLGEFVPDEPDVETELAELLRKHGAFSDALLKELIKFVEGAEREAANNTALEMSEW